jgi:hypothetical protein
MKYLSKNIFYDGTRRGLELTESSGSSKYFIDSYGDRYQVKDISGTQSVIQATDNRFCISYVTQENSGMFTLNEMKEGEVCIIDCDIIGVNAFGNRGVYSKFHAVFRRGSGSAVAIKGPDIDTTSDWAPSDVVISFNIDVDKIQIEFDSTDTSDKIEWSAFVTIKQNLHTLTEFIPI